jgi:hypothetical protein
MVLLAALALVLAPPLSARDDADASALNALVWLEAELGGESAASPEQTNRESKRVVAAVVTAWLEELYQDDPSHEAPPGLRERLARTVVSAVRLESFTGEVFANWTQGFAAFAVFERGLRGGGERALEQRLADGFRDRQNAEGAWNHGLQTDAQFYPSTLIASTNLALITLGLARRRGVTVDAQAIDEALALLRDVQSPRGAFPYGGRPYRRGFEAGRTAGTVVALAALGRTGDAMFRRACEYLRDNVASIPDGHASPAMHVLLGALCCQILGGDLLASYRTTVVNRVLDVQREDGSFDDVVAGSPDSLQLNSDERTDRAYRTALYAAALAIPRSRIAELLATPIALEPRSPATTPAAAYETVWMRTVEHPLALQLLPDRAATIDARGRLTVLARDTGEVMAEADLARELRAPLEQVELAAASPGVLVAWVTPRTDEALPHSLAEVMARAAAQAPARVCGIALAPLRVAWTRELDGSLAQLVTSEGRVLLWQQNARAIAISAEDGREVAAIATPPVYVTTRLLPLGGDRVVLACEAQLELWDLGAAGSRIEPRWRVRQRARNLVPAAWSALGTDGDRIAAGLTSGAVCWVDPATGVRSPEVALGHGEVAQLAALDADRLVALCGDGTVVGLARGAIAWQALPPARESPAHPRLRVSGAHVLVDWPGGGLTVLDGASGKALRTIATAAGALWSTDGGDLLLASASAVSLIRIGAR